MEDNIIYYDFRYEARRVEMEKLLERAADRLQYYLQNGTFTEEQRLQSEEDAKKVSALKLEASVWGDDEFLEE